jgi:hypothetical protein
MFRTAVHIPDRKQSTITACLRTVITTYAMRGFKVCDIHGDHEFECVRNAMAPIHMEIVAADSHVGEIERSNRTVKERIRACTHGLPFKRLPKLLLVSMVADVIRCLNMFPAATGFSDVLSPLYIVTGAPRPDFNAMKLEFGSYVQVFDAVDPTNTNRARTFGAIALFPTGNAHGDYYFLSLATGARVSRHRWHELPIPDTAIARVEALAKAEKQPLIQNHGLVVEWRPDHAIDDDEYDRDFEPPADPAPDPFPPADYDDIDDTELDNLHAGGLFVDVPNIVPPAYPHAAAPGALEHQPNPDIAYIIEIIEEEDFPEANFHEAGAEHNNNEGAHDRTYEEGAPNEGVPNEANEGMREAETGAPNEEVYDKAGVPDD